MLVLYLCLLKLLTDIEETTEARAQVPTISEINASKDNLRNSSRKFTK